MGTKTVLFSFFFGNRADTILPNKPFSLQKTVLSPRNTHISAWNPYWRGLSRTTMCSHIPTHIGWLNCLRRRGDSSFPASSEGMKMRLPSLFEMLVIDESIPPPPQQGRPTSLHRVLNDPLNVAEDGTHTGLDRRPRLPFLPMTGVPKCSGLVRGSLSRVCTGDKDLMCRCLGGKKEKQSS